LQNEKQIIHENERKREREREGGGRERGGGAGEERKVERLRREHERCRE